MYMAVTSMYEVVKARVRVDGDVTEAFMCSRGLKQGDSCSPVMFSLNIFLMCMLGEAICCHFQSSVVHL